MKEPCLCGLIIVVVMMFVVLFMMFFVFLMLFMMLVVAVTVEVIARFVFDTAVSTDCATRYECGGSNGKYQQPKQYAGVVDELFHK